MQMPGVVDRELMHIEVDRWGVFFAACDLTLMLVLVLIVLLLRLLVLMPVVAVLPPLLARCLSGGSIPALILKASTFFEVFFPIASKPSGMPSRWHFQLFG